MNKMPPRLSDEQRSEALAKAIAARRERADLKLSIKTGMLDPVGILKEPDSAQGGMRAFEFLTSCPGIAQASARRILGALGISESRRLRGLGSRQRRMMALIVEAVGSGEPASVAIRDALENQEG